MNGSPACVGRPDIADAPRLSRLGLGAYPLGGPDGGGDAEDRARSCLDAARDAGCSWVDTGEVYHDTANEDLLGRIGLRGLAVATKVAPRPAGSGLQPLQIAAACRASLHRLRVDALDWYYLHWPDSSGVPVEDSWGAMRALVDEGLVRRAGLSNFGIALMQRCLSVGPIDVVQLGLSLVDHRGGRDVARWCGENKIPVTVYEPLANGLLCGAVTAGTDLQAWAARDVEAWPFFQRVLMGEALPRTLTILDALHHWSEQLGTPVAQIALAWVLAQPGVVSVLPGSRQPGHIRLNAAAAAVVLPPDALRALDQIAAYAAG
jgi:aryl-alcohol dehydrogenase-like predicted oxidoreductase